MRQWPKWLRTVFVVAGILFVLGVLFSIYVSTTNTVVPPLSAADPSNPGGEAQPTNVVVVITAVTGLVTAISGLYGQILAGRKMKLDYDLAKRRLEMEERTHKEEKKG
jgi:hypothetical protein